MKFEMKKPCEDCPFLRKGGIRLTQARVGEIAGMMLSSAGGTFACHKTTEYDEDGDGDLHATSKSQHCAGALIFAEKNENATQMMRIAERLGLYDAASLMADKETVETVFEDMDEMIETNAEAFGERKKKRRKR